MEKLTIPEHLKILGKSAKKYIDLLVLQVTENVTTAMLSIQNKLLPDGGSEGQVLMKSSNEPYAVTWGGYTSNPNLFVNSYFVGGGSQQGNNQFPMNANGQTEYEFIDSHGITIDGWDLARGKITLVQDGLEFIYVKGEDQYASEFALFSQTFEYLPDGTYTLSAIVDGKLHSVNFLYGDSHRPSLGRHTSIGSSGLAFYYERVPLELPNGQYSEDDPSKVIIHISTSSQTKARLIAGFKLEAGDQQTYAHEDVLGNLILNDLIPNNFVELLRYRSYHFKKRISNKNLLINWYFVGGGNFPINQHGDIEYKTNGYIIDGWRMVNNISVGTVGITDDGLMISHTADNDGVTSLRQRIKGQFDQTMTFSILTSDNELYSVCGENGEAEYVTMENKIRYGILKTEVSDVPMTEVVIVCLSRSEFTIKAVKLEFGDQQTLAYQNEDDEWVMIDPEPDYVLELAKCRYYYRPMSYSCLSKALSATSCQMRIAMPKDMNGSPRFVPTFAATFTPNGWDTSDPKNIDVQNISGRVVVTVNGLSSQTTGTYGFGEVNGAWDGNL